MKTLVHLPTQEAWDRYMEWAEKKGWKRCDGRKPTAGEASWYCHNTHVQFGDRFAYRSSYTDPDRTVISLEEAIGEQFVEGDVVLASSNNITWHEGNYLCVLPGGRKNRYIILNNIQWSNYISGYDYSISMFTYIRKKPTVVEMTVQQISEKLGYEVKIVK